MPGLLELPFLHQALVGLALCLILPAIALIYRIGLTTRLLARRAAAALAAFVAACALSALTGAAAAAKPDWPWLEGAAVLLAGIGLLIGLFAFAVSAALALAVDVAARSRLRDHANLQALSLRPLQAEGFMPPRRDEPACDFADRAPGAALDCPPPALPDKRLCAKGEARLAEALQRDTAIYDGHLRDLLRELTHRSKNLMAIVQGIARQTGDSSENIPDFLTRFGSRLQALSSAHELLVELSWRGVGLRDLVEREMQFHAPELRRRVSIIGEPEFVSPEASQNIALCLHEMTTNAIRYGALSDLDGKVRIAWRRLDKTPLSAIEFEWIETGGPKVAPPLRCGFGLTLIKRLAPRSIDGESDLRFAPEGLSWKLVFPANPTLFH